jgi:hypothetical protein
MREDMAKLLVERPRLGGGVKFQRGANRKWQRLATDDRPRFESIKARWNQSKVCRKSLNENLAPLRRFLRSRCGRPWDEVYGEISQRINRDSAVQLHVWQHLTWEVATDPVKVEKLLTERRRIFWRAQFYVEPATGVLRELIVRRKRVANRAPPTPFVVVVVDGVTYRKIDGLWYEIELAPLINGDPLVWDTVLRKHVNRLSRRQLQEAHGKYCYARRKWQLNGREIRRLEQKLKEDADRRERR